MVNDDPEEATSHLEQRVRLFAVAPYLLAALKGIVDGLDEHWMTEHPEQVQAARDAIEKAEGT